MARLNENFEKFKGSNYLFAEIARRTKAYQASHPGVKLLKLGVGNTTEPLTGSIVAGLHSGVEKLGNAATYTGYGDEQGDSRLRQAISEFYSRRGMSISADEVFISDGAKSDAANIQSVFSSTSIVAVQDPAYPVYVDSNVIAGRTGVSKGTTYDGIVYMPCTEQNGFFPSTPKEKVDLIYLCSPNNPTGSVATKAQLKSFVDYARENKAVIIFDAAYHSFISDPDLPRSIYEVSGAYECAIEINSFSKSTGFTGVRLGWSIVPKALVVEGSSPGEVNSTWNRRQTTMFNGASNIVQEGGLVAISEKGIGENKPIIDGYLLNASNIKKCLSAKGLKVFGGVNAPYLWVKIPDGFNSWSFFDKILDEAHVIVTPGSGFGPSGEGYIRVSAFGHKNDIDDAISSINANLGL